MYTDPHFLLTCKQSLYFYSASDGPPKVTAPPITPVSGPDWQELEWKDDGLAIPDYPNLPRRSYQLRDPNLKYWDQQDRRNFGEPVSWSFCFYLRLRW